MTLPTRRPWPGVPRTRSSARSRWCQDEAHRSSGTAGREHNRYRLDQDHQVDDEALLADILDIELQALPHGERTPAADLPQAAEARPDEKALAVGFADH